MNEDSSVSTTIGVNLSVLTRDHMISFTLTIFSPNSNKGLLSIKESLFGTTGHSNNTMPFTSQVQSNGGGSGSGSGFETGRKTDSPG